MFIKINHKRITRKWWNKNKRNQVMEGESKLMGMEEGIQRYNKKWWLPFHFQTWVHLVRISRYLFHSPTILSEKIVYESVSSGRNMMGILVQHFLFLKMIEQQLFAEECNFHLLLSWTKGWVHNSLNSFFGNSFLCVCVFALLILSPTFTTWFSPQVVIILFPRRWFSSGWFFKW